MRRGASTRGPHRTGARPNYALRRLVVLLGVPLAVVAVVAGLFYGALRVRELVRSQDEAQAASQVRTVYAEPTTCAGSAIETTLSAPASVAVGQPVVVTATMRNTGTQPCLVDGGSSALVAVVTSGEAKVWASTQCAVQPTSRPLLIDAGATSRTTLTWDGRVNRTVCPTAIPTPTPGAAGGGAAGPGPDGAASDAPTASAAAPSPSQDASADPSAAPSTDPSAAPSATGTPEPGSGDPAGAGTYQVHLELGGRSVTDPTTFTIG